MVLSLLFLSVICSVTASPPVFKPDAGQFISADYKKSVRRGVTVLDYTKLVVEARVWLMLEPQPVPDKQSVRLEYRAAAGEWVEHSQPPHTRAGRSTWLIPNIVPCRDHSVRLTVAGLDGAETSFTTATLVAPDLADIIASDYTPAPPASLTTDPANPAHLSWAASPCAAQYHVNYYQAGAAGAPVSQLVTEPELTLPQLDTCKEYVVSVSAVTGEQYSEEVQLTFTTPPGPAAADRLQPLTSPARDSVTVQWRGFEELSCIDEYEVRLCGAGGDCRPQQKLRRDDSLQVVEFSAGELEECSEYHLTILPHHPAATLQPRIIEFRTRSQPLGEAAGLLGPGVLAGGRDVEVSWNSVQCAERYQVYTREEVGEWELVADTQDSSYTHTTLPCTRHRFGVSVTVDGEESEIVEHETVVETAVEAAELPRMNVLEKSNGSVAFTLQTGEVNTMCEIDQLHIRHGSDERYYDNSPENSKIVLNYSEGETERVEGRVRYRGSNIWSPWISSDAPIMEPTPLQQMNFLLPIIIGSVVALALIVTVIAMVVRSKKVQTNYDTEKANGTSDESRKLNDSSDEKAAVSAASVNGKKPSDI